MKGLGNVTMSIHENRCSVDDENARKPEQAIVVVEGVAIGREWQRVREVVQRMIEEESKGRWRTTTKLDERNAIPRVCVLPLLLHYPWVQNSGTTKATSCLVAAIPTIVAATIVRRACNDFHSLCLLLRDSSFAFERLSMQYPHVRRMRMVLLHHSHITRSTHPLFRKRPNNRCSLRPPVDHKSIVLHL